MPALVDDEWLTRLRAVTDDFVDASRALTESTPLYDLEADHTAGARGPPVAFEDLRQFLGQERLPLVVLPVVLVHPVRVEAGLAADGQHGGDVLVREERLGVRLEGPAVLVVAGALGIR